MSKETKNEKPKTKSDLRKGTRGSLICPNPPLAGGEPLYALEDPPLASPDLRTPSGQVTHE